MRAKALTSGASGERTLHIILLTSLLLKLALLVPGHQIHPVRDAWDYDRAALQLHQNGRYESTRAPLFPLVLYTAVRIASICESQRWTETVLCPPISRFDLARLFQVIFSTISVWLVYLLGRELFDNRAGLVAAGIFAFYPEYVAYTQLLWAETLFTMLNVGWVLLLVRGLNTQRLGLFFASGAVLGLAALTRQVVLSFLLAVVAWTFLIRPHPWRDTARLSAALVVAVILVVGCWTARNAFVHGAFVPVEPKAGHALLFGASSDPLAEFRKLQKPYPIPAIERDRLAGERAREIIRKDPGAYLRLVFQRNLPNLWAPDSMMLTYLQKPPPSDPWKRGYLPVPTWLGRSLVVLFVGAYIALMITAAFGAALAPRWRETLLTLGMAAHASLLHAIVSGMHRHRLYLMVFFILYAGFLLSRRREQLRDLVADRTVTVLLTLLVVLPLGLAAARHPHVQTAWDGLDRGPSPPHRDDQAATGAWRPPLQSRD